MGPGINPGIIAYWDLQSLFEIKVFI